MTIQSIKHEKQVGFIAIFIINSIINVKIFISFIYLKKIKVYIYYR